MHNLILVSEKKTAGVESALDKLKIGRKMSENVAVGVV